jgi:hypothetical protein
MRLVALALAAMAAAVLAAPTPPTVSDSTLLRIYASMLIFADTYRAVRVAGKSALLRKPRAVDEPPTPTGSFLQVSLLCQAYLGFSRIMLS